MKAEPKPQKVDVGLHASKGLQMKCTQVTQSLYLFIQDIL